MYLILYGPASEPNAAGTGIRVSAEVRLGPADSRKQNEAFLSQTAHTGGWPCINHRRLKIRSPRHSKVREAHEKRGVPVPGGTCNYNELMLLYRYPCSV